MSNFGHRSITGDVDLYGEGFFQYPRASPSVREADISQPEMADVYRRCR